MLVAVVILAVVMIMIVLVLVIANEMDLAAKLSGREFGCMNIAVSGMREQRLGKCVEVAWRHILRRRTDDARGGDRSADAAAGCRTGRRSRRRIGEIGAEENHDATRNMTLAKMDMRLRYVAAKSRIGQGEAQGLTLLIEIEIERPLPV